jgi:hypothetical protein
MWLVLAWACQGPQPPLAWGQWIWTAQDVAVFEQSRAVLPDLRPAVWIGTVHFEQGQLQTRLGQDPLSVQGERAVLIRLDDDLHAAWDALPEAELARQLDERLGRLMALLRARGVEPVEVQLDYDCPVRRLSAWASVLRVLTSGSLAGERVWITSLVAHLREPRYGAWLRGVVHGHVLQVFDTGDDALASREVGALASRAGLPYRMGLGAFERPGTAHALWFETLEQTCMRPTCDGAWVFPAGRVWSPLAP